MKSKRYNLNILSILILLATMLLSHTLTAQTITGGLDPDTLNISLSKTGTYDDIETKGLEQYAEEGFPALPSKRLQATRALPICVRALFSTALPWLTKKALR